MRVVQIIGQPGSGKTTLVAELVSALVDSGLRVGSIKHSAHAHELDKKGKDSYIHRVAGASPVTMMTRDLMAMYMPRSEKMPPQTIIERFYSDLDLVLIEGWIKGHYPKIEVFRPQVHTTPLFTTDVINVGAIVCDDLPEDVQSLAGDQGLSVFQRKNVPAIVDYILKYIPAE